MLMPHMITVDRNGSVWVTDTGRHQVLKFSASGQLLMTIGKEKTPGKGADGLCKPTQVRFRLMASLTQGSVMMMMARGEGDDCDSSLCVCVCVCPADAYALLAAAAAHTLLATLAFTHPHPPPAFLSRMFVIPQVAFMNQGDVLVSDGYCNSRVVRYDAAGRYLREYALPGGRWMDIVHSVAVSECDGELAVAEREGRAVHRFSLETGDLLGM